MMDPGRFLERLVKHNTTIAEERIEQRYHSGGYVVVPGAFTDALANLTEKIDFGCRFDEEGHCQSFLSRVMPKTQIDRCCCHGCAPSIGYLRFVRNCEVFEYAKMFNQQNGFWRPKTGCILPRSMRSITCLTYRCVFIRPAGSGTEPRRLPPKHETILGLLSHIGDAYDDYSNWRQHTKLSADSWFDWGGSILKYIDVWVKRVPKGFHSFWSDAKACTWKEYYEKDSNLSKQNVVAGG